MTERDWDERDWDDKRMENIIANILRAGVILSAAIVMIGGAAYLFRHGTSPADYRIFRGEPSSLRGARGIAHGVVRLQSRAVIQLGLLFLIATPVARVVFAVYGFAEERDRLYVAFTVLVLAILAFSLLGSH